MGDGAVIEIEINEARLLAMTIRDLAREHTGDAAALLLQRAAGLEREAEMNERLGAGVSRLLAKTMLRPDRVAEMQAAMDATFGPYTEASER